MLDWWFAQTHTLVNLTRNGYYTFNFLDDFARDNKNMPIIDDTLLVLLQQVLIGQ